MRTGTLNHQDIDYTDCYQVQFAYNKETKEYTMDLSHDKECMCLKGKKSGNVIVFRDNKSTINLYQVEEDLYYGEWNYPGDNPELVKLDLDEVDND